MIDFLKKTFTRESTEVNEERTFVPFNTRGVQYSGAYSPAVARCLGLYTSMLISCPLEAEPNPLLTLMNQRPCSFMSRSNFFEILVQNYFLYEGFFAKLNVNNKGEITELLPFISPNSISVYPVGYRRKQNAEHAGGDWDPIIISEKGYYFRDYKGRTFNMDEMLYIRGALFNTQNPLEQQDRFRRVFTEAFNSSSLLEAVIGSICRSDLKPPLMLTGLGFTGEKNKGGHKASGKETAEVKKALRQYFSGQSQGFSNSLLALPPGYDIQKLNMDNPASLLSILNTIVSSNIANIFQVPQELVYSGEGTERTQKEARRFFLSGAFKGFCDVIAHELNHLTGYQYNFRFNIDSLRVSQADLREEASLAQLVGIFSPEEIKKMIKEN